MRCGWTLRDVRELEEDEYEIVKEILTEKADEVPD